MEIRRQYSSISNILISDAHFSSSILQEHWECSKQRREDLTIKWTEWEKVPFLWFWFVYILSKNVYIHAW